MGGQRGWLWGRSGAVQLARLGTAWHGVPAAALASASPAQSSLFVNNGAGKIAPEMPLGSALCCLNASTPEVPARRRHKGCWKGGEEGMGSSERFQGGFTPHCPAQTPSARMRGQRQALTHMVGTIMPSQLGHA